MSNVFIPMGASVNLAATQATGNVALTSPGDFTARYQVRVVNAGSNEVFIRFGDDNTITATLAAGIYIPPSPWAEVFTVPGSTTYAAAICNSGETTTVYFTSGFGA